jgi:hypothetical protein
MCCSNKTDLLLAPHEGESLRFHPRLETVLPLDQVSLKAAKANNLSTHHIFFFLYCLENDRVVEVLLGNGGPVSGTGF